MMLYPSLQSLSKHCSNRYELCVATAKRARQIADDSLANNTILDDKPIKLAVEELDRGAFVVVKRGTGTDADIFLKKDDNAANDLFDDEEPAETGAQNENSKPID